MDRMRGGPGFEASTPHAAVRPDARIYRRQYLRRCGVGTTRGKGRLRCIFQTELDHFRHVPAAQFRDQRQHEIDAGGDTAARKDIAVLDDPRVVDDGAEDRQQFPPGPVAGSAAALEKSGCAQDERPRASRGQIARRRPEPRHLPHEIIILDRCDAAASARYQQHVAGFDRSEIFKIGEGEAINRDRLATDRRHVNLKVGRTREKLVWPGEIELGDAAIERHHDAERLWHHISFLHSRLSPHGFDLKAKLPYDPAMAAIGFYISPGFQILDLAGPAGAFEAANHNLGHPAYRIHIVAAEAGSVTNSLGIATAATSLDDAVLDTLLIIGGRIDPLLPAEILMRIVDAAGRCRRVASVCTGAFILAAAGLLDGRRATTHWRHAARLQREYSAIRVEADRIFCRDGNIWTSAGITAGIDLALALIEEDHGFAVARAVAQHLVVYHRRHGGQSQFAASIDLAPRSDRISAALGYARDHIAEDLPVERLAEAAGMSLRQFSRTFRAQTGTTPARVVERLRADLARGRLETTAEPVEGIAEAVGFGGAENMRRAFIRIYGRPPQSIRRAIRT